MPVCFSQLRLGSSADCPEIGDIVISKLCPALSHVVGDGLKPHLTGFQMFGRVQVNVWKVAEVSAEQGKYIVPNSANVSFPVIWLGQVKCIEITKLLAE